MRRTLVAALVLFCAWTGVAHARTTTGRVDSTSDVAPRVERTAFRTRGTVTIRATLHWMNAGADLRLSLSRHRADGSWRHVARTATESHPQHLVVRSAPAGRYRLAVRAVSGRSRYRLVVNAALRRRTRSPRTGKGPFLTLLFSRSEVTDANRCTPDTSGSVNLITGVAPELARRGLIATGSVETGITRRSTRACVHYKRTLTSSWNDLARLRDRYGWRFVSHGRTFVTDLARLSPKQQWSETCGSIIDLERHGFWSGDGLFAYPDNQWSTQVETNVVSTCFAFGRRYAGGPTIRSQATASPYWQRTQGIGGGRCRDTSRPCSRLDTVTRYHSPRKVRRALARLGPDQWLTLQSYVFVKGDRKGQWHCNARSWRDHWTDDPERYCWSDYLRILDGIPAGVTVTDPKTVARAWGRTDYRPPPP